MNLSPILRGRPRLWPALLALPLLLLPLAAHAQDAADAAALAAALAADASESAAPASSGGGESPLMPSIKRVSSVSFAVT